jgi:hypothetical protein
MRRRVELAPYACGISFHFLGGRGRGGGHYRGMSDVIDDQYVTAYS